MGGLFYGRADKRAETSQLARGRVAGRWADPLDAELDDAARGTLCVYHEKRARDVPALVRVSLWRGLVARWSRRKCLACRGFDVAPETNDAEMDAALRDAADVIAAKHAGRGAFPCRVCAWCGLILETGRGTRDVSHGICPPCSARMLGG